jgi:hypothetical protein
MEQLQNNPEPKLKTILNSIKQKFLAKPLWQRIVLGVAVFLIASFSAYLLLKIVNNTNPTTQKSDSQTAVRLSPTVNGNPPCTNSGRVTLTKPVVNPDDLKAIWPLGRTANGHVTPTDHQYYIPNDAAKKNGTAIYAPADGVIFGISSDDATKEDPTLAPADRMVHGIALAFSCNQAMTLGHLSTIAPEFQKYISNENTVSKPIAVPVKAGQKIGTGKYGMDVWLIDTTSRLTGFIDENDYQDENWKPYSFSLADYFVPALRDAYNAKSLRKVPPLGGKIDYDQPGKLAGNWFRQGSLPHYFRQTDYWQNELAIFYDYIEPAQIRIMIGRFAYDKPGNFGFNVVGNAPDPATISVGSGLVKYSLVNYTYADESGMNLDELGINLDELSADKTWHVQNEKSVWGVALVQMLDDRKIKFEAFPGKNAAQVTGFDSNVIIYER